MTQSPNAPMTPRSAAPRRLKLILALSLTLNLVVLALIGGVLVRGGPGGKGDRMMGEGFGVYAQALPRADRMSLFAKMRGDPGSGRAEREAHLAAVAAALRAQPFRPEDLKAAMAAQEARMTGQITQAHALLLGYLTALDAPERAAFAERLSNRGPHKP